MKMMLILAPNILAGTQYIERVYAAFERLTQREYRVFDLNNFWMRALVVTEENQLKGCRFDDYHVLDGVSQQLHRSASIEYMRRNPIRVSQRWLND